MFTFRCFVVIITVVLSIYYSHAIVYFILPLSAIYILLCCHNVQFFGIL